MTKHIHKLPLLIVVGLLLYALIYMFDTFMMMSVPLVKNPTPDPLSAKLSNMISQYENGEISVIDLSLMETFSWDRFYVFGPYTSLSELESTVGRSWRNICFTHIDVLENYALLVFAKERKVVHCLEYPTHTYDFSSLANYSSGFSAQEANFVLDESGNVIWAHGK